MDLEDSDIGEGRGIRVKHYYVAVGSRDYKIGTLVDLVHALNKVRPLTIALCCGWVCELGNSDIMARPTIYLFQTCHGLPQTIGCRPELCDADLKSPPTFSPTHCAQQHFVDRTRDTLDDVVESLSSPQSPVICLHSDLTESERHSILTQFGSGRTPAEEEGSVMTTAPEEPPTPSVGTPVDDEIEVGRRGMDEEEEEEEDPHMVERCAAAGPAWPRGALPGTCRPASS